MKKSIPYAIILSLTIGIARADLATINYVNDAKSDWTQTEETEPNYIKNKPEIVSNIISDQTFPDTTIPNANAVKNALKSKADTTDTRFDTIPTKMPNITPENGRALIWVE